MENEPAPEPTRKEEAEELDRMVIKALDSAHGLLETNLPLAQANIKTVIVGLHKSGRTMITANMSVDTLIYALATAHAQACRIKEEQGPKIHLPDGPIDIKKLKRLREG